MPSSLRAQPWVAGWAGRGALRVAAQPAWADGRGPAVCAEAGDKVEFVSSSTNRWIQGTLEEVHDGASPDQCAATVVSELGAETIPAGQSHARIRRAARISLVAPGGGIVSSGPAFSELDKDTRFRVHVVGKKSTQYDRYPEGWGPSASPPPNLNSFAADVLKIRIHEQTDCFIFGSRGGQCVIPVMWSSLGNDMPPCVVLNGGCAHPCLPGPRAPWPDKAVTIMLLGGQDYFKGHYSGEEYVRNTCSMVPATNGTTAFLYLPEMKHMPGDGILKAILPQLVCAALQWRLAPHAVPVEQLTGAAQALERLGWSGRLRFTAGPGAWREAVFGPPVADLAPSPPSPRPEKPPPPPPPCELGTAVSVFPLEEARTHTIESHRSLAQQYLAEAAQVEAEESALVQEMRSCSPGMAPQLNLELSELRAMRTRLLEFAAGQESEAYAMVLDKPAPEAKPADGPDAKATAATPTQPAQLQQAASALSAQARQALPTRASPPAGVSAGSSPSHRQGAYIMRTDTALPTTRSEVAKAAAAAPNTQAAPRIVSTTYPGQAQPVRYYTGGTYLRAGEGGYTPGGAAARRGEGPRSPVGVVGQTAARPFVAGTRGPSAF